MDPISLFKAHPWHGLSIGPDAPHVVTVYVELVPTDTVKYEMDKVTGILKIDRPQMFSNVCPTMYGFLPQTLCAEKVGELCQLRTGRTGILGDGDPMDICVLTEKDISHGNILLRAIPIGGLRMIDKDQADDKIISVMKGDAVFGDWKEIEDCAPSLIQRLKHYFLTYKKAPDSADKDTVEITHVYGREEAYEVIQRSQLDYETHFYQR